MLIREHLHLTTDMCQSDDPWPQNSYNNFVFHVFLLPFIMSRKKILLPNVSSKLNHSKI